MAITTQDSTQLARELGTVSGHNMPTDYSGGVHIFAFDFTQTGVGDIASIGRLVKTPFGRMRIVDIEFDHSALGGTIDIGHAAYSDTGGTAVAASATAFKAASATTMAGTKRVFVNQVVNSRDGIIVQFTSAAAIPDGATVSGVIRAVPI